MTETTMEKDYRKLYCFGSIAAFIIVILLIYWAFVSGRKLYVLSK